MKLRYCRHCKKDVPMFNNKEYAQLREVFSECIRSIKEYRRINNATLPETPLDDLYKPFGEMYERLAGVELEFDVDEVIRRHYLARWKKYKHEAD